jgi:hypothetical protein
MWGYQERENEDLLIKEDDHLRCDKRDHVGDGRGGYGRLPGGL